MGGRCSGATPMCHPAVARCASPTGQIAHKIAPVHTRSLRPHVCPKETAGKASPHQDSLILQQHAAPLQESSPACFSVPPLVVNSMPLTALAGHPLGAQFHALLALIGSPLLHS